MHEGRPLSRRRWLQAIGAAGAGLASRELVAQVRGPALLPSVTDPNPPWNSVGPLVAHPEKAPLIQLTDRPVQLETPRHYYLSGFTPNPAFYVRWHLDRHPNAVSLSTWRLEVAGNVTRALSLSFDDLTTRFPPVSIAAVNQCSGNSRSRFQPRVPGGQWGNGAMGNAVWTGVRLSELLNAAGVKAGSVQVQFEGLDRGPGPEGRGSHAFLKSLPMDDPVVREALIAYAMNGEPIPLLNGFPARLVVPGYFATYWVKALTWIRVLERPDENFWMKSAYQVPDTPRGSTTPEDLRAGRVKTVPITRMPVRSFIVAPDGSAKLPAGLAVTVRGIAFSGANGIRRVEVSTDVGGNWATARLLEDLGPYAFRAWEFVWTPPRPGRAVLMARATDGQGVVQPDEGVWNAGGYLWNRIERQEVVVGTAN